MIASGPATDPIQLERAVLGEFFWVLGLAEGSPLRRVMTVAMQPVLRRFVAVAAPFDRDVATYGMPGALRARVPEYVHSLVVSGAGSIPATGPLLLLSNHPGGFDLFLTLAQLPRDDVKVIVSEISILRHLPATGAHFISIGRDDTSRMQAVRAGVRHMRQGGALFIFPGGILDPDPAFMPGAVEALGRWSPSVELLLRRVPETNVLVSMAGGVLSEGWYRSPVTRLRQERKDRQKVAEVFQVAQQLLLPGSLKLRPQIHFAPPISAAALGGREPLVALRAVGRTLLLAPGSFPATTKRV